MVKRVEFRSLSTGLLVFALLLGASQVLAADTNLLANPTFEGAEQQIPPPGWLLYRSLDAHRNITVVNADDPEWRGLLIEDAASVDGTSGDIGLYQAVPGGPGRYRAVVVFRGVEGMPAGPAYLQIRFMPSGVREQVHLSRAGEWRHDQYLEATVELEAPADTTEVRIYLYTSQEGTVSFIARSVHLYKID